eukprot:10130874-Alexandrium_andersonii.AAC.1
MCQCVQRNSAMFGGMWVPLRIESAQIPRKGAEVRLKAAEFRRKLPQSAPTSAENCFKHVFNGILR